MPQPTKTFKCGICQENIGKTHASVQCRNCAQWIHVTCAGLQEKALSFLKDNKSLSFNCANCNQNPNSGMDKLRDEMSAMNSKLDQFIEKVDKEQSSIQQALMDTVASFKSEMASCLKEMKSEIIDCNKLIRNIDTSTTRKIIALEDENNILHKRLNRGDIIVVGLPGGLEDLVAPIIKIGSIYNLPILPIDINHVFYFKNRRAVLVKFNNIFLRDRIMVEYFKTRTLKICDVIGGEIDSRIYLNDHYSPAAGRLNTTCKKLLRKNVITKFRILNGDKLQVKLTMADGKDVLCDSTECNSLLNEGI